MPALPLRKTVRLEKNVGMATFWPYFLFPKGGNTGSGGITGEVAGLANRQAEQNSGVGQ